MPGSSRPEGEIPQPHRPLTVAVVAVADLPLLHLSIPADVFGTDRSAVGVPRHHVQLVAAEPGPLRSEGVTVVAEQGLEALAHADVVLVPWPSPDVEPPVSLTSALVRAHRRGAVVAGLCAGSFVLAAAGLLDGHTATAHWLHVDELAGRFPQVRVDPHSIFVDEGDVLTCAGTSAAIDLCLHLLRRFNGAEVAAEVARRMVTSPRSGSHAQVARHAAGANAGPHAIEAVMAWAHRHLHDTIGVEDLAAQACMSRRHFYRRFREVSGLSPHQWLLEQRVQLAQELLEHSDLPVEAIAQRAGFGSPLAFRTHFVKVHRMPPSQYRASFRSARSHAGVGTPDAPAPFGWPESVA